MFFILEKEIKKIKFGLNYFNADIIYSFLFTIKIIYIFLVIIGKISIYKNCFYLTVLEINMLFFLIFFLIFFYIFFFKLLINLINIIYYYI